MMNRGDIEINYDTFKEQVLPPFRTCVPGREEAEAPHRDGQREPGELTDTDAENVVSGTSCAVEEEGELTEPSSDPDTFNSWFRGGKPKRIICAASREGDREEAPERILNGQPPPQKPEGEGEGIPPGEQGYGYASPTLPASQERGGDPKPNAGAHRTYVAPPMWTPSPTGHEQRGWDPHSFIRGEGTSGWYRSSAGGNNEERGTWEDGPPGFRGAGAGAARRVTSHFYYYVDKKIYIHNHTHIYTHPPGEGNGTGGEAATEAQR